MADEPSRVARIMVRATRVAGIQRYGMVIFPLGAHQARWLGRRAGQS
jgi:hypothetical protein